MVLYSQKKTKSAEIGQFKRPYIHEDPKGNSIYKPKWYILAIGNLYKLVLIFTYIAVIYKIQFFTAIAVTNKIKIFYSRICD